VVKESLARHRSSRVLPAAAVILAAATLAACSDSSIPSPPPSGPSAPGAAAPAPSAVVLKETGSSLLYPLFGIWATSSRCRRR
jgi:ABC-type phosphate transport system substrate-binding protein